MLFNDSFICIEPMQFSIFLLFVICLSLWGEKPNVLMIAIDDQNDWIGYLGGHPMAQTPHIDKLAKSGTAFTNAHCQSPLCNPSRTSLMFGLRPSTTGIYGLAPWIRTLPPYRDHLSLPQYLKKHGGYQTSTGGKIYHGRNGRGKNDREFDEIGPASGVGIRPRKKLITTPFGNHPLVDWGVFPHKDEDKQDYKVASWTIEELKKKRDAPFFITTGFFLPHVPCYATQKWFDLFPDDDSVLPEILRNDREDTPRFSWYMHWYLPEVRLKWLEEANQWRNLVRSYLACTSFIDAQVGRVLQGLEESGHKDDTIVILWSDHGWHIGEKEITGKNTLWDDSTRVPLIFAGPGVQKGGLCQQPAELLDVYPTLLDLCKLPQNEKLEGLSLLPQLLDENATRSHPAITTHNQNNHGIRSEGWRFIQYADGSRELYDMRNDPNEWKNLAHDPKFKKVIDEHVSFLPEVNNAPAPGSRSRILTVEKDHVIWEGKKVLPSDPIPGI